MNEKLKYAPGKPGFGSKGETGADGHQGLSMYFTDFEASPSNSAINVRIMDNTNLWVSSGTPLPDGRIYVKGDLIIDSEGRVYEIDPLGSPDKYTFKYANLNLGGFFVPLGANSSEGYQRYFNSNSGQKYIIDNVYTVSGAVDYTSSPTDIYGISPVNYTRVEFTNVKQTGNLNAFTTYTINNNENDALAIVYDENNSEFHIGNKELDGTIRDTNLTFDVSSLIISKQIGVNTFNPSTLSGAVLTNYEIAANSLFDPNFNNSPDSFIGITGVNDCSITWVLSDFTNDSDVKGDLYFYQQLFPHTYNGSTFTFDASIAKPIIFSNLDASGSVYITGLRDTNITPYEYYMKLTKEGWSRNSATKTIFTGLLSIYVAGTSAGTYYAVSSASTNIWFDVSSAIGWTPSIIGHAAIDISTWGMIGTGNRSYDGSIAVTIPANTGIDRIGKIGVTSNAGQFKDASLYQYGDIITVYPTLSTNSDTTGETTAGGHFTQIENHIYELSITNLPASSYIDVSMNVNYTTRNYSTNAAFDYDVTGTYITVKTYSGTTLKTLLITPTYNPLPSTPPLKSIYNLVGVSSFIHLTNIPYTSFPLVITIYNKGMLHVGYPGSAYSNFSISETNVYRKSGPDIYVIQTTDTKTTSIVFPPAP